MSVMEAKILTCKLCQQNHHSTIPITYRGDTPEEAMYKFEQHVIIEHIVELAEEA